MRRLVSFCLAAVACPTLLFAKPVDLEGAPAWQAAKVEAAADGERAIVRIPLVRRAADWACDTCPDWYIGNTPEFVEGRTTWLAPTFSKHAAKLQQIAPKAGMIVQAEGFYTGKTKEFVWTGTSGEQRFEAAEFHVQRWRPARRIDGFWLKTLLEGPRARETVEPIDDDRPWLVIAHTLDLRSSACTKGAELRRERLEDRGFDDAEIIDSRQAPMLGCCSKSVLIGRHTTRVAAAEQAKDARVRGQRVYVRRGW